MMYYFVIKEAKIDSTRRGREFGVIADSEIEAKAIFSELKQAYDEEKRGTHGIDLKSVQYGLQQRWQFAANLY